ncbi:MAG: triose-phosphate isomerase [Weeksellaceae bacterium]|nr:triose-phosphate isomerase [Weeksellaceae bacterium]
MRRKIVVGNWKMNKTWEDARSLLMEINRFASTHKPKCLVIVAPPYPYLDRANDIFMHHVEVAAQNVSQFEKGAYTGEISAEILKSIGVKYVIIGHSERRTIHHETNEIIRDKVATALAHGLNPILCCGETLDQRVEEKHLDTVRAQIETMLDSVSSSQMQNIILAYEPVWAIGTGHTASPHQAQEMHELIRGILKEKYGDRIADETTILYGGSVNSGNADDLFAMPDIDGGLIGGASLNAGDFGSIINASCKHI